MTAALSGIGVSRGIAIGKVHILHRDQLEISEYVLPSRLINGEISRFNNAVKLAKAQLQDIRERIPSDTSREIAAFIDTHLLMLDDEVLTEAPIRTIGERHCNAEWALKIQRDELVDVFEAMDDAYLRTRTDDIDHVVSRIQRILLNEGAPRHEVPDSRLRGYIVMADDLSPADTVLIQHHGIVSFITEFGGPTSHAAILSRSLKIPGIVGLRHCRRYIKEGELIIVDGLRGVVLVNPDERILRFYRKKQKQEKQFQVGLKKLRSDPSVTMDNVNISLQANIELPDDVKMARQSGAMGIGLYRTEFMFVDRDSLPGEDEQLANLVRVIKSLQGLPVTIRTFDLGGDKQFSAAPAEGAVAANPALGLRAIRLCLKETEMFRTQLRAIWRAAAVGPVRMVVPMLSNAGELQQVLQLVAEVRRQLQAEGQRIGDELPVGGMIEVPAAALCAEEMARHLDFFSIGTNDLIQYTIAIDRVDESVSYLYDPLHPAVLKLIKNVLKAGKKAGIPVAMCGEMAGDIRYTRLLLGMGLREFSMHPASLLEVKRIVTTSDVGELAGLAKRAMRCNAGDEIARQLERMNQTEEQDGSGY